MWLRAPRIFLECVQARHGMRCQGQPPRPFGSPLKQRRCRSASIICYSSKRGILLGLGGAGLVLAHESPGAAVSHTMPKRKLADGLEVSECIKGCWQLSGGHRGDPSSDRTRGKDAVLDFDKFVDIGITSFDTADIYGPSEKLIGKYLQQREGGSRGIQILTKCCKFGSEQFSVSPKSISAGIRKSLERLSVPSVDLVQFYWNDYNVTRYVDTALYLMDEVAAGRVKHLGVTNFDVPRIQAMLDAGAKIVSNQVQYSLLDRRPENAMVEYCKAQDIKLLAFGTVAGGLLSEGFLDVPQDQITIDTYSKSKYSSIIKNSGGFGWFQQLLKALASIAQKHDTSIANIASRWVLNEPTVAGVIVGARNASHVPDHAKLPGINLDIQDLASIQSILAAGRPSSTDVYTWERGGRW